MRSAVIIAFMTALVLYAWTNNSMVASAVTSNVSMDPTTMMQTLTNLPVEQYDAI